MTKDEAISLLREVLEAFYYDGMYKDHPGLSKMAREALAATESVDDGWMPIETAPETGENYLGIIHCSDGTWGQSFVCYWDIDEHHICQHQTEARLHRPTHWMPLPPPPINQAEGGDV